MDFPAAFESFSLPVFSERFICGGSALLSNRKISRKRLALVESIPTYPDIEAQYLLKEIQSYQKAKRLFDSAKAITHDELLNAHACFLSSKFKLGQFRTTQNWIGESLEKAVYVPPSPEEMNIQLQSWYELVNTSNHSYEHAIECYVRLLAIHPFPDANGRVARALLDVMISRLDTDFIPLPVYKIGIAPEVSRAGYKAFGIDTHEGGRHPYWQSSIYWAQATKDKAQSIINRFNTQLKNKLGMFSITPQEIQVIDYLWRHPITTPLQLQQSFKWDRANCHSLIEKLYSVNLLTSKRLRNNNNQVVLVCETIFQCFDELDLLFFNKREKE